MPSSNGAPTPRKKQFFVAAALLIMGPVTLAAQRKLQDGPAQAFRKTDIPISASWIAAPWSTERDGAEADGSKPLPIFRRAFSLQANPVEATLRIAGLGQWQATLAHGQAVQPVRAAGLNGEWTNYRKTVAFDTLDVTRLLMRGSNVLAVMLGNGMYNVQQTKLPGPKKRERYTKFSGSFGPPKMLAELRVRYADGRTERIVTDEQWRVTPGPVLFDSAYGGEDFDARRAPAGWERPGFDANAWAHASVVPGPGGELLPALAPAVGQHEHHAPSKTSGLSEGRTVFDFGTNFAGIVRVHVKGPAGATLRLTPGELLNQDGSVSQRSSGGPMWWSYTLRGDPPGETWEPLFGYSGFRYVQAEWIAQPGAPVHTAMKTGQLLELAGIELHSNAAPTGTFISSSEMLNRIHTLIVNAMHNNEVSLLTDCPHREKLGWLEQTHLVGAGLMFNNDMQGMYRATARNMADAQLADGIVPTTAPQYTRFGPQYAIYDDSPEWGSAAVLTPWRAYSFYGDKAELQRAWPMMPAYVAALEAKAKDGIVVYGLGDWYDVGPGAPGFAKNTSLGVTGTLMLLEDAQAMAKIAALLGRENESRRYATLAAKTIAAFNRKFWSEEHGWYDTGSQTAQAMPLALGVVPAERRGRVLQHLLDDVHIHSDHTTAGEVGFPYLLHALSKAGRDDVVLAMLLRKDPPSYGSQLEAGATALTETWDAEPHASQDHFMLGAAEEWFYRSLGGIDIDLSRTQAAERLTVRPAALDGVNWVHTGFDSVFGHVQSDWKRTSSGTRYTISVPKRIEATVVLPANTVPAVSLKPFAQDALHRTFRVRPGTWTFQSAAH